MTDTDDPLGPLRGMMSPAELAEELGVKERTIRDAANRGEIPAYRLFGKLHIDRAGLAEWLESKRLQPVGNPKPSRNRAFTGRAHQEGRRGA